MTLQLSRLTPSELEVWMASTLTTSSSHCPQNPLWSSQLSRHSLETLKHHQIKGLLNPTIHHLKVTTLDTGHIIAVANWITHLDPSCPPRTTESRIEEERTPAMSAFLHLVNQNREKAIGTRPHIMLTNLSTLPAHRGKGAARMLIQYGLDLADKEGVEVYTEAHEASRTLYEKFGFKVVRDFEIDYERYGGVGRKRYFCMIRQIEDRIATGV